MGLRITFSGLLCTLIVLLIGLAALNSEANLLFLLFGISLGAILFNLVAPAFIVRGVEAERVAPAAVVAGRTFTLAYPLRSNRRWLRCWSVVVGEVPVNRLVARFPHGFVPVLRPDQRQRVEVTGICPRRGRTPLEGVRLMSRFPFGLFACFVDVEQKAELVVYPAVGRFRRDPWRERRASETTAGNSPRRAHSEHEEFYGLREYRQGDNLRWIHWRRSARLGQLVVRESTPARTQQLTVILDPWPAIDEPPEEDNPRPAAAKAGLALRRRWASLRSRWTSGDLAGPAVCVEQIVSLAATAICDALERGHRVGLIVRAAVPVVIAPSGGRSQRQRLLHELAMLKVGGVEGLDELVTRVRWSSGWQGRCLLCAAHYNRSHERVLRFLAGRAESAMAITCGSDKFELLFEPPSDLAGGRVGTVPGERKAL